MTKDMTTGSPVKLILFFSIPLLIGNIFQQFYSMVDTIIVGRFLGVKALAAVGSTGSMSFLILGFVLGLCSGFSVLISQKFGANDNEGLREAVASSIILSVIMAIIITIISIFTAKPLLHLMNTPNDIINDSSDSRLVNRATQGKYIPGSIFKIITTLDYMRENKNYNKFNYYCDGKARFKGFSIKCFDGTAHGSEDLTDAFAHSCNSAFSTIGDKLDVTKYRKTAEDLLFNKDLPLDIDYNQSVFALDSTSTQFDITQTSIGQGKTTVSPAHMAMIASAIANDGVLMKPYIIDRVENSSSNIVKQTKEQKYKTLMTSDEAKQLRKYMSAVCTYGTGKIMANANYKAYGKTGTAEIDKKDNVNSWFVGFAKKGKKKIAIAVVIEKMPEGSNSAVNCAKEIFDNYFD